MRHEPCRRFSSTSGRVAGLACSGARRRSPRLRRQEIVSLRKLFVLAEEGFHEPLPSNGGKLLIATGLEGALDALSPDDAEAWTD